MIRRETCAVPVDDVDVALAREDDPPPVGRPGRPVVEPAPGQSSQAGSVRSDQVDAAAPVGARALEDDRLARRRPVRIVVDPRPTRESARPGPVRFDHVEVRPAAAHAATEDDSRSVGRPRRVEPGSERPAVGPVGICDVNVSALDEGELRAVGRPGRRQPIDVGLGHGAVETAAVRIRHPDVRGVAHVAVPDDQRECDLRAVGRPVRFAVDPAVLGENRPPAGPGRIAHGELAIPVDALGIADAEHETAVGQAFRARHARGPGRRYERNRGKNGDCEPPHPEHANESLLRDGQSRVMMLAQRSKRAASSEPPVASPALYECAPAPASWPASTIRYSSRIGLPSNQHSRISRVPAA